MRLTRQQHYSIDVLIEVLTFEGCPNRLPAVDLVKQAVAEVGVEAELRVIDVEDDADAQERRFLGSPTICVDGRDVEPGSEARSDFVMSCRVYRTPSGLVGLPSIEYVTAALSNRA